MMEDPREQKHPRRGQDDLRATPLADLSWKPGDADASLATVFDHVRKDALEAADWYSRKKRPKRRIAIGTQILAMLGVGVAAALPLVGGMLSGSINPLWISLSIAVGAGAIAFDRIVGSSVGWVRYVKTEQQIRDDLEAFELEWQADRSVWQGNAPSTLQVSGMLDRAKSFANRINAIVQEETNAWAESFQGGLKHIEDALKARESDARARTAAPGPGALNLTVSNGDQCPNGWTLRVDDGAETAHTGKTASIPELAPGRHLLRVEGVLAGANVQAECVVEIASAAMAQAAMTMA